MSSGCSRRGGARLPAAALAVALVAALACGAPAAAVEISPGDLDGLRHQEGEFVSVTGTIVAAHIARSGKVRYLDFDRDYRKSLALVIFTKDLPAFESSVGEPTAAYLGRKVRASGRVTLYQGRPEIILAEPEQLEVLDAPPAPAPAPAR
jgi:hypothetical protein